MIRTGQDQTIADLYLRLSDARSEEALDGREAKLRAMAAGLGWTVHRVVIENDMVPVNGNGTMRPASAFKRKKITTPSGKTELRTVRPGFRSVLDDITSGRAGAVLAEDLDRVCRDPRDLEDLIDACEQHRASARSLSGSLTFTDGGTDAEISNARLMVTMANKSSRDTARRVADARERLAGQSYGGGRRPYGYRPDPDAEKYHKKLIVVEEEAVVLRDAAAGILDRKVSLKAIAADLRDRGVPTVTGAAWSAETLKDILLKDALTGLTDAAGNVVWPAILEQDTQDRLRDLLASDSREVTGKNGKTYRVARDSKAAGNAPRWLVSGIAVCGTCNGPVHVTGGRAKSPGYVCTDHQHVRRNAVAVDEYVAAYAVERLESGAADLLRPPPRPGTDTGKLRAEARKLEAAGARQAAMHAVGDITDAELKSGSRARRDRLAVIAAQLAASDQPDPLAEFRDRPAAAVWESLSLPRKRAVVRLLMTVAILPATRRGAGFDPDSVRVEPRAR